MSTHSNHRVKIGLLILGIIALVAVGIFAYRYQTEAEAQISNSAAYAPTDDTANDALSADRVNGERLKSFVSSKSSEPIDTTALDNQINTIINENADIHISVAIKDLNSNSVHNYGFQEPMTAASVNKVLTAVDFMNEVELGNKSLDMIMADGNTAQYDIEQMIVYSDNDSWHTLNDSLTYQQMQEYAHSIGLASYYYGDNSISTADVTKLLGDTYQRKLIDESHTQLLLSYLERANYRGGIVPAVPEFDTVYHKAGVYNPALNDAAIITNGQRTVVLTIFTDSITSYNSSRIASIMQQITTPTLQTFGLSEPPKELPDTKQ